MGTHKTIREVVILVDRSEYTLNPGLEGDLFVYQNPITEENHLAFTPDDTSAHWFQHYMEHVGHEIPKSDHDPDEMIVCFGGSRKDLDERDELWFVDDDFQLIES